MIMKHFLGTGIANGMLTLFIKSEIMKTRYYIIAAAIVFSSTSMFAQVSSGTKLQKTGTSATTGSNSNATIVKEKDPNAATTGTSVGSNSLKPATKPDAKVGSDVKAGVVHQGGNTAVKNNNSATAVGVVKTRYDVNLKDPKSVVNAMIYAAKERDFKVMPGLVDPLMMTETKERYPFIAELIQTGKVKAENEQAAVTELKDYINLFESAKINGTIQYKTASGYQLAYVPVWVFNLKGSSNLKVILIKRYGNWYFLAYGT